MHPAPPTPAARRLVGIDLGIASAHTAVVIDHTGTELTHARCHTSADSLADLQRRALADAAPGTRLAVVLEIAADPAVLLRLGQTR